MSFTLETTNALSCPRIGEPIGLLTRISDYTVRLGNDFRVHIDSDKLTEFISSNNFSFNVEKVWEAGLGAAKKVLDKRHCYQKFDVDALTLSADSNVYKVMIIQEYGSFRIALSHGDRFVTFAAETQIEDLTPEKIAHSWGTDRYRSVIFHVFFSSFLPYYISHTSWRDRT